jgi:hypothetical protein
MTMSIRRGHPVLAAIVVAVIASGSVAAAEDPCAAFSWDVTHERALFAMAPESAVAGREVSPAPLLMLERLYELRLAPQGVVTYAVSPQKQRPVAGAYGGLAHLKFDRSGTYRVSLDQGLWIDMVTEGKLIASSDFQGRPGCRAPHKIVQYVLPAGQDVLLQLSGGHDGRVRITITRSDDAPAT